MDKIEDLNPHKIEDYKKLVRDNNVSGRVLLHCSLQELKEVRIERFKNFFRVCCLGEF